MEENEDLKKQIAELKGKTFKEIAEFLDKCVENGQSRKFTKEDMDKIIKATEYAKRVFLNKMGCYKR